MVVSDHAFDIEVLHADGSHLATIYQHGGEVLAAWRHADGDRLDGSVEPSVQACGYVLRFWNSYRSFAEVNRAVLRAVEALLVLAGLEPREAHGACVAEEVPVGGVEIAERALKGLGVDLAEPFVGTLQFALHLIGELHVADGPLLLLVGFNLEVEPPVVDEAAAAEGLGEQDLLLLRRVQSIFEGSKHGVS